MTQPWLYMRHRSSAHGQVAVFKDINRQLVQIGPDFGTDEYTGANSQFAVTNNRVAHWNNDIYALNGNNGIYKYNEPSGTWDLVLNWSPVGGNFTSSRLGFTACSINGSGVLVCAYPSASVSMRPVYIYGDGTIAEGTSRAYQEDGWTASNTATLHRLLYHPLAHRNYLYFMIQDLTFGPAQLARENINRLDLTTGALALIDHPSNLYGALIGGMCVHNDKVFYICMNTVSSPVYIHRVDGTTLTTITSIPYDGLGNANQYAAQSLVSIDGRLFAFYTGNTQVYCYEIVLDEFNNYVTRIDRSTTVLPPELRGGGARFHRANNYYLKVDTITDPENPQYFMDVMQMNVTDGQSVFYYAWQNAPDGQLVFVDAGLDAYRFDRVSMNSSTGGERVWGGSGTLNASPPRLSLDGANIKCAFTVYGVAQTGIKAQVVFDKEGEIPSTLGTLVSSTSGTLNGNVLEGLVANGQGEIELTWAAALDGIAPGDNPSVAIRVFA